VTAFPADFVGNPFDATKFIENTASAPGTGPRLFDQVANPALACTLGVFTEEQRQNDRFGRLPNVADPLRVAPPNGATAQQAITALNQLDIEVLAIGTPFGAGLSPGPFKPSGGDDTNATAGAANGPVLDAAMTTPSPDPYKWMTAVARLTGARDPNSTNPGFTPQNVPLVYDLGGNLGEDSLLPPSGTFNTVVVEDLTDRIEVWLPFLPAPTTTNGCVSIRWMFDIEAPLASTGLVLSNVDFSANRASLQLFEAGTTPPAPVFVDALVDFARLDPASSGEVMATLDFVATPIIEYMNPVGVADPTVALPDPVSGTVTIVLPATPASGTPPVGEFVLQPGATGCFVLTNVNDPSNTFTSSDCGTLDPATAVPATDTCAPPVATLSTVRAELNGSTVPSLPPNTDSSVLGNTGYRVVLLGTNFTDGSTVTIGGLAVPEADVESLTATEIVVIPPRVDVIAPDTSATVDVTVTTQFGTTGAQTLLYDETATFKSR
jgi:hypothetical protein